MSIRSILLGADENGEGGVGIFRGTKVKDSPNHDSDLTDCFDESVPEGDAVGGGTLEMDKLDYDSIETYIALEQQLMRMSSTPAMISTFEEINFKGEAPYTVQCNYMGCIVNGNDMEHEPKKKSVRSLKFIYSKMIKKVNGTEITID